MTSLPVSSIEHRYGSLSIIKVSKVNVSSGIILTLITVPKMFIFVTRVMQVL